MKGDFKKGQNERWFPSKQCPLDLDGSNCFLDATN